MRFPVRLPEHHPLQRWLAVGVVALIGSVAGLALWAPVRVLGAVRTLDQVFYDSLYRLRRTQSQVSGPIVIVAVDDESIEAIDKDRKVGWPWPRDYWGKMVTYLDSVGAKAIVIDLLFDRSSVYNNPTNADDQKFAEAIDASSTPVILATVVRPDGSTWNIAPPVTIKTTAAANISNDDIVRSYTPFVKDHPSLALAAMARVRANPPAWAQQGPFLLHYYGPHVDAKNNPATFRYVRAAKLLAAYEQPEAPENSSITPDLFKDKIVFIATITAGTYDLKASPLSPRYPGVELHATALQNMLSNQRVIPVGPLGRVMMLIMACFVAGAGSVLPGRVPFKLVGGLAGVILILAITSVLFLRSEIRWLPPAATILAAIFSAFVGLGWSYLTEVRQRRFLLKALTQYVSKDVADKLRKDPRMLSLHGERREMTVMFTDLANFTALSESLDVQRLADMLNFYLQEMSGVILEQNGTLDKYIGDSIMSFWNAPLNQSDHAKRACHAAMEMRRREKVLEAELKQLAGGPVHSRIGINSGPMIVGNMGSSHKFDYTVLGDAVNLASRLESANKMYGTRILLSETTAQFVQQGFILRKIDMIRVKGKTQPMAIYELMGEGMFEPGASDIIERYEKALALYQARNFNHAWELLISLAQDFPQDGPTATLLARVLHFRDHPPDDDWDGVYVATEK